jgi:sulfur carrier protein
VICCQAARVHWFQVRGRDVEPPPCTLADLVRTLGLEGRRIALEHNGVVVPKSLHASVELREGDRLEIVHAVGGG